MPTRFRWTPGLRWIRATFFALLVAASAATQFGAHRVEIAPESRWWWALPVTAASVLLGSGIGWLLQTDRNRRYLLVGAFVLVTAFAHVEVVIPALLAHRGEEVRATVVELRVSGNRRGDNVHYRLAEPDGKRLPGEWTAGRTRQDPGTYRTATDPALIAIGAPVTLLVDPRGTVHPRRPEDVSTGAVLFIGVTIAVPALLLALNAGGPLGLPWTPEQLAADERRRRQRRRV